MLLVFVIALQQLLLQLFGVLKNLGSSGFLVGSTG